MSVTPDQIEQKSFTVRHIRGYDPTEVDDFLDLVVASYRETLANLQALQQENVSLRRSLSVTSSAATQQMAPVVMDKPAAQGDPIGDVARLLSVAQQAADQQAAEAKAAADKVIADANAQVGSMIADGQRQADAIIAQGNSKRNEIVGELEVKRTELQSKVDTLTNEHTAVRDRLTAALNTLGGASA